VTVQILHLSDPHFGGLADIRQMEAVERMLPDLRPDAVVISGDAIKRELFYVAASRVVKL
jgi:3',5'-cyclic AMP phosphodiesterase CpdA